MDSSKIGSFWMHWAQWVRRNSTKLSAWLAVSVSLSKCSANEMLKFSINRSITIPFILKSQSTPYWLLSYADWINEWNGWNCFWSDENVTTSMCMWTI